MRRRGSREAHGTLGSVPYQRVVVVLLLSLTGCVRFGFVAADAESTDTTHRDGPGVDLDAAPADPSATDTSAPRDERPLPADDLLLVKDLPDGPALDLPSTKKDLPSPDQQPLDDLPAPLDTAQPKDLPLPPDQGSPPVCIHPTVTKSCTGGWCFVPAGCFHMGSPSTEKCRLTNETLHDVTLTHAFEIAATEVTQAQFQALMGSNPSSQQTSTDLPVETVTWHEAAAYCNALTIQAGLTPCYVCSVAAPPSCATAPAYATSSSLIYDCPGYRLPTDAEWEYAARAGTTSLYPNGGNDLQNSCKVSVDAGLIGWYVDNGADMTHPVGLKQANGWGLYDVAGNVREWVHDRYLADLGTAPATNPVVTSGTDRVVRNGWRQSWGYMLRSAARGSALDTTKIQETGFRCVRSK